MDICNECGLSVAPGSGRWVNRVPDFNDIETRREMGKSFPEGDWVCFACDIINSDPASCTCHGINMHDGTCPIGKRQERENSF